MFKHVSKRLKRAEGAVEPTPLVDEDSASSSESASDSDDGSASPSEDDEDERPSDEDDDGRGASGRDVAEELDDPLVGTHPNQRCLLCPLKQFKNPLDATAHLSSADHQRRRARVEAFYASDEGTILAVNYDLEAVVELLDERREAERPPRPPPKPKAKVAIATDDAEKEDGADGEGEGTKRRRRKGTKLGKKQREALKGGAASVGTP